MIIVGVRDNDRLLKMFSLILKFVEKYESERELSNVYIPDKSISVEELAEFLETGSEFFDGIRVIANPDSEIYDIELKVGLIAKTDVPVVYFSYVTKNMSVEKVLIFKNTLLTKKFLEKLINDFDKLTNTLTSTLEQKVYLRKNL